MRLSINWLRQYVDIKESPQELADLLTMLGFEAEVATDLSNLKNIVTAKVESVVKHPNADKLSLCQINDGNEIVSVVCGAPNVDTGQIVVFAKVGAILPGDFEIKKAKIRGEVSFGMICAEDELGISEEHEGIMVLPDDTKIGLPVSNVLNEKYAALELDLTPNRPDALSHYGIAREVALKTNRKLIFPEVKEIKPVRTKEKVTINISDPDGCPRYIAGVVDNIKIGPSPTWMKELLESAGQRSINNVVDISNFVLLETGHPTHIFDIAQIPTNTIGVRRAQKGEKFVTLDEEEHTLDTHHLLITDGKTPIALAGIMGGLGSAVNNDTKKVLIESAYFDPITIRKGSKSLGMLTESSRRFERGADPDGAVTAFWRIVSLLKEYANGEFVSEMIDNYPKKINIPKIQLRKSELDIIAGCDIPDKFVSKALTGLDVEWKNINDGVWECKPPSFRPDLENEIDLIEEIIRIYGYDNIPISTRYGSLFNYSNPDPKANISKIINTLTGIGFHQCYNNSLLSKEDAKLAGENSVKTLNPLSEKLSDLRTSLLPGLLTNIDFNIKNGNKNLQLFEIGQLHLQKGKGFKGIIEKSQLAGIVYGFSNKASIHNETPVSQSFFTLKGYLDNLFNGILNTIVEYTETDHVEFEKCFTINVNSRDIGFAGIVNSELIKNLKLDIENKVFRFEIDIDILLTLLAEPVLYKQISKFPTIQRDLNFVIAESVKAGEIIAKIKSMGIRQLKSITPTNLFRHASLGENKKSIVYNLIFQDDTKTLEDKDVNSIIDEIISIVKVNYNA
ncbi:MAG: phenylalanine--tRNA ligase subunit beta, partial [Planctomycetia bacterium]|nr:phenylalanine--tRNA ligase subunit beta [Planctomycetia bacterium]